MSMTIGYPVFISNNMMIFVLIMKLILSCGLSPVRSFYHATFLSCESFFPDLAYLAWHVRLSASTIHFQKKEWRKSKKEKFRHEEY